MPRSAAPFRQVRRPSSRPGRVPGVSREPLLQEGAGWLQGPFHQDACSAKKRRQIARNPADMDYSTVTEVAGDRASSAQLERIFGRYYFASDFCAGKDVLEIACGTGQGI